MAVVTVDQTSVVQTAQLRLAAYAVQRFLRALTTAEKTAAIALLKDAADAVFQHWSGGYANSSPSTQNWAQNDFAPTSLATARVWTDLPSNRPGLDSILARLDEFWTARPAAKLVFIMFDHPQAMLQGGTRSSGYMPWPPASQWGSSGAGQLATELIARYGSRIMAFEYGLELKGVNGRTNLASLDAFAAGYTAFATYMRANHPTVELWYPHFNFWASWGTLASRRNAMDAMIAGGSAFETNDEITLTRLMQQVSPTLIDRWTLDTSIVDFGTVDTWRGDYAAVVQRVSMPYHVGRVVQERMIANWGVTRPLVHVESYFDVNQADQDWATDAQSAALQTAILMWCMKGGQTYHARWEPQGGTPGNEAPNGNIASWFDNHGVAFPAWAQARDLVNTFPPGTLLNAVSTDNASILAIAGGGKLYILNTSGAAINTSVTATGGTIASQSIPAYDYVIADLPVTSFPSAAAGPASGIGNALKPNIYVGQARLTVRMG